MTTLRSVLLVLLFIPATLLADERILSYQSSVDIASDGRMEVTEKIRVRAEGKQIRRGIYRDFPTRYKDRFGNRYNVDFEVVSVIRNGHTEAWHTERRSNGIRVYFGSSGRFLDVGEHTYTFKFTTNRQLGYFDGYDELYWNAVGQGWDFPIDQADITITLPEDIQSTQWIHDSYTGFHGSQDKNTRFQVQDSRSVRFESTQGLLPGQGMTIALGWSKGVITQPSQSQRFMWFLKDNRGVLVGGFGLLAIFLWYITSWFKVGRDPDKGVIIPLYKPPEKLSAAACRYILKRRADNTAFTAAMVSLAIKGYLDIDESRKDFTVRKATKADTKPLSPGETALLNKLFSKGDTELELDDKNHRHFSRAQIALRNTLKREYSGHMFKLNGMYILPGILMSILLGMVVIILKPATWVIVSFIAAAIIMHIVFVVLMPAPTRIGRMVMDKIEGFRLYLKTAEADRLDRMESPQLTPEVFEMFLPYAFALGVDNEWSKNFRNHLITNDPNNQSGYNPSWYQGNYSGLNAINHFSDNFGSSFSSAISSASTPPGSSSGSSGGGFSGGGGGGGGGGGW